MHRRSIADISPTISAKNQQLSPNVRRTLDYIGDALATIRQTIACQIFHRNCWYLCSKSQGIRKHRVYNYTFHRRDGKWDRGISHIPHYVGHLCTLTISLNWPLFACSWNSYYAVGLLKYMAVMTCTNLFHSGLHCKWIQSCIISYNTEQQLLSLINVSVHVWWNGNMCGFKYIYYSDNAICT